MLHGFEGESITESWHAYESVTVLGKSREHVFLNGFLEMTYF